MAFHRTTASRFIVSLCCAASTIGACSGENAPGGATPDAAQVNAAPQIVGEGVISTELPEFATALSPDGNTMYFNRMPADRSSIHIWASSRVDSEWSAPAPLGISDSRYRDIDPFVSADGSRLYFSSNRPVADEEPKDYDLWYLEQTEAGWSDPINPGAPLNTADDEIYSTVSRNGYLYYSTFNEDDSVTIHRSLVMAGGFGEPEVVTIGTAGLRLTNPTIAPDESFLLFVSPHEGDANIYVSRRGNDGTWLDVERLNAAVNSPYTEFAPALSPDGSTLYFTSERPGIVAAGAVEGRPPGDIYSIPLASALPDE